MMRTLQTRERILIAIAALVIGLAISLPAYRGLRERHADSVTTLAQTEQRYQSAVLLKEIVEAGRTDNAKISEIISEEDFNVDLYGFVRDALEAAKLSELAEIKAGGRRRVSANQQIIEVSIQRFALQDLVNFLHALYDGNKLISVQRLDYLRAGKPGTGLECSITIAAPKS